MMRRIQFWWLRMRFLYLQYRYNAQPVNRPDLQYLNELVSLLHPVHFARYESTMGLIVELRLLLPHVGDYTKLLQDSANLMETDEVVPREWLQRNEVTTTLDHWLSVSDGLYIDPTEALYKFREALLRVLAVGIKNRREKSGVHAANFRVMRNLYLNLETLLFELVSIVAHK